MNIKCNDSRFILTQLKSKPLLQDIIRTAINNSSDANAKNLKIIIDFDNTIIFEDDGNGMDLNELQSFFFNQGYSHKNNNTFTENGLGTINYFRSKEIIVMTYKSSNKGIIGRIKEPLKKLNQNENISYDIESTIKQKQTPGTFIKIKGFECEDFEEEFSAEAIKNFINFNTYISSLKYINDTRYNLISKFSTLDKIEIEDRINNIYETINVKLKLNENINPPIDPSQKIYTASANFLKVFSFNITDSIKDTNINFQIYGMVCGSNIKKEIITSKLDRNNYNKFGIYIANKWEPHFKINDLFNDIIPEDCHLILNSNVFELSNNRITNLDDKKVKLILKKAEEVIRNQINPVIKASYYSLRKKEKMHHEQIKKVNKMKKFNENSDLRKNLNLEKIPIIKEPNGEPEILNLITALLISYREYCNFPFKSIKSYNSNSPLDVIVLGLDDKEKFIEIENKASSFFLHNHPFDILDYLICWEMDLKIGTKYSDGNYEYNVINNGEYNYISKNKSGKLVQIYELSSIIDDIKKSM